MKKKVRKHKKVSGSPKKRLCPGCSAPMYDGGEEFCSDQCEIADLKKSGGP